MGGRERESDRGRRERETKKQTLHVCSTNCTYPISRNIQMYCYISGIKVVNQVDLGQLSKIIYIKLTYSGSGVGVGSR